MKQKNIHIIQNITLVKYFLLIYLLTNTSIIGFAQIESMRPTKSHENSMVSIAGKSSGAISKHEILQAKKLVMKSPHDTAFHVISFMMTFVRKGQPHLEIRNNENGELTEKMLELTASLIAGDKVYFEYIKCRNIDGTTRSFGALSFLIE